VRGGGDVEEDHFVRALLVVAEGEFHRVADIAQAALFGDAELDAARDLAGVDVKAWDDAFGNHGIIETRLAAQRNFFRVSKSFAAADVRPLILPIPIQYLSRLIGCVLTHG
jgi:hypothetical protein